VPVSGRIALRMRAASGARVASLGQLLGASCVVRAGQLGELERKGRPQMDSLAACSVAV